MNSHFRTSIEIFDPSSKSRTRRSTFFTQQLARLRHSKASERLGGLSESGLSVCPMFRITTIRTDKRIRLVLEGKLVSPWLTELVNEWNSVRSSARDHIVVVELRDVTMIGEEAEPILTAMMSEDVDSFAGRFSTGMLFGEWSASYVSNVAGALNRDPTRPPGMR